MNRLPQPGDLITIGSGKKVLLVINTEWLITTNVFDTMPTYQYIAGRVIDPNAKVTRYHDSGWKQAGTQVDLNTITLVGTCKFNKNVVTTYTITSEKSA